jgi:hypothetical protein
LIGIPELSKPVKCELSQYFLSFFRVPQPLAIHHELPSSPPQNQVIEEYEHQQQQKVQQCALLTYYSTVALNPSPDTVTG